jgi:hypothetical protein
VEHPPEESRPLSASESSNADAVMLVLGALFFLVSFLTWYRVRYIKANPPRVDSYNAWRSGFFAWASVLIAIATATFAGARIAGVQLKMRITASAVWMLSGVTIFFLTALRFLVKPAGLSALGNSPEFVKVSRAFGLFVALLIAIGMLVTGFRAYQAGRR